MGVFDNAIQSEGLPTSNDGLVVQSPVSFGGVKVKKETEEGACVWGFTTRIQIFFWVCVLSVVRVWKDGDDLHLKPRR